MAYKKTIPSSAGSGSVGEVPELNSSGVLDPSFIPDPSSSTLGGVESYTAPSHQWINEISTSGVPSSTQPTYSDISNMTSTGNAVGITNSGGTALNALTGTNQVVYFNSSSVPTAGVLPSNLTAASPEYYSFYGGV